MVTRRWPKGQNFGDLNRLIKVEVDMKRTCGAAIAVLACLGVVSCGITARDPDGDSPATHSSSTSGVAPENVGSPGAVGLDQPVAENDADSLMELASAGEQESPLSLRLLAPHERARILAPCALLSWGQSYCLGLGFTDARPNYRALARPTTSKMPSGDLSFRAWLDQRVTMTRAERLAAQSAEARAAVLGLDKALSLSLARGGS
jgi:hypothetical protein